MLRLIVVLAFAFVGLQFPSYYFAYIQQLDFDTRTLERGSAPQSLTDLLRQQRQDLMVADAVEWPIAFVDTFDADRAEETLFNVWEPKLPNQPEEWAYGGAGLILGFFITGLLSSLLGGGRPSPTTAQPARRPTARPWASADASATARPTSKGSRIPVSTGNLREASRVAKQAFRQARQTVASATAAASGDDSQQSSGQPPSPMQRRVPMAVQRAATSGAVIPSHYRPPAITRRFESPYAGPIERLTRHRD